MVLFLSISLLEIQLLLFFVSKFSFQMKAITMGWGAMFFGGPSSNVLMEVSVPIWTSKACQNVFIERIGENVLCAGAKEGGRDSCQVRNNYFTFFTYKIFLSQ